MSAQPQKDAQQVTADIVHAALSAFMKGNW